MTDKSCGFAFKTTRATLAIAGALLANVSLAQVSLPGTIQAEAYDYMNGVDTENTSDAGGGKNVGWIDANDWMSYSVNPSFSGWYKVDFRVASNVDRATLVLGRDGKDIMSDVTWNNTYGWQNWTTVSSRVYLNAGAQNLTLFAKTGGFNINWFSLTAEDPCDIAPMMTVPSRIQAESYCNMQGIQTEGTTDTGGGINIGWTDTGDWMDYRVYVAIPGSYTLSYRAASMQTADQVAFTVNNVVLANSSFTATGGWQNWQTYSTRVTLAAGLQTIRLKVTNPGFNLNWFELQKEVASSSVKSSSVVSSSVKSSIAPSSAAPSSVAPSSVVPSSVAPSSVAPSSKAPSSAAPSSVAPSSIAPSSVISSSRVSSSAPMSFIRANGAQWVDANNKPITLKGTNLGNWLLQEYWMMGQEGKDVFDQCTLENKLVERFGYAEKERLMKLYHDSWITERDFNQIQAFGLNIIRLPINWNLIEDEKHPKTLRADAWYYLDWTIEQSKKRGIYVILDLHGVQGGQTSWQSAGCSGLNTYWTNVEQQDRAKWLWQQIANRYKNEPAVVAYDLLNEPWGSTPEDMATRINELYNVVRTVDDKHVVLLPAHFGDIDVYGDVVAKGMKNVAFEIHPYPGLFGDRPGDSFYSIHRDWLRCGADGLGGVCDWNTKMNRLKVPLLVGEFQPWQSAGLDLGGQIARATYDTFASYNWAATNWAYKFVSTGGGQGKGTWGMVTNAPDTTKDTGVGLVAKASTWDCAGWDSTFATACAAQTSTIKVGGTGSKTYYFVIKVGAAKASNPDITFDKISVINNATGAELIANGDFGANNGWKQFTISSTETIDFNNRDTTKTPTGGEGASLRFSRPAGVADEINGGVYQAITLTGGQTYTLKGVFKDNTSENTWAEMYLVDQEPVSGQDVVDMTGKVNFSTAPIADIENLFKSYATQAYDVHSGLAKWLTSPVAPTVFNLPARPTNLRVTENASSLSLTWDSSNSASVIGYKIYRKSAALGNATVVANKVVGNSFVDTSIQSGVTYYYSIAALTATDESYLSDEVHSAFGYFPIPAKIEAEAYVASAGIAGEACSDVGGGFNIGHFETDDFIEFNIDVARAGNYAIDFRLASESGSAGFVVLLDGQGIETRGVDNTGGWQTWATATGPSFWISAGKHKLRLKAVGNQWNINWINIKAM